MLCKAYFHNYVADIKNEMFDGAANVILNRLAGAAEAVGQALGDSLQELAEKVSAFILHDTIQCLFSLRSRSASQSFGRARVTTRHK